jgi:hypothetical protein
VSNYPVFGQRDDGLKESLARYQFAPCGPPRLVDEVADRVTGKGQQVQGREHAGQMLLTVTEVMLKVISFGFQGIKRLILNFPAGSSGRGHVGDIVAVHRHVGDEAVRRFGQLG